MPAGKMSSQVAHASRLSLLHFIRNNPDRLNEFVENNVAGSMVVVKCKNLSQLTKAFEDAKKAGFPCAMFTDSGHVMLPHFDGSPVTTAVAIGPATKEEMRSITKKFQSVKDRPTKEQIISAMKNCEQTTGVSVLDHGNMVRDAYLKLVEYVKTGVQPEGWRIPEWVNSDILAKQMDSDTVKEYQIYHDCSKPYVRKIDEDGKVHFPDHAKKSYEMWKPFNPKAANLMKMDMDAHLLKADGIEEFSSRPEAATLLMTAVAEIHANAEMFGGLNSDSFKIKIKNLTKRGKQVINSWNKGN